MYDTRLSTETTKAIVERIRRLEGRNPGDEEKLKDMARFDHVLREKMGNLGIEYLDVIVGMMYLGYPDEHIRYYINLKLEDDESAAERRKEATRRLFDVVQREICEMQGLPYDDGKDEGAWEDNVEAIKDHIKSELEPYFTPDQLTEDAVDRVFEVLSDTHKYSEKYSDRKLSNKDKHDIRMEIELGIARPMFRRSIIKAVCGVE